MYVHSQVLALCYSYKWLIHSWTKDQFKIVFLQPMVAVTVDVSPVCELGEHCTTIYFMIIQLRILYVHS